MIGVEGGPSLAKGSSGLRGGVLAELGGGAREGIMLDARGRAETVSDCVLQLTVAFISMFEFIAC